MSPARRGRSAWAVPLLLFGAVLLTAGLAFNLANLDTGGEAVPGVPDAGGSPPRSSGLIGLLPLVQLAAAAAAILVIAFFVYDLLRRERDRRRAIRRVRRSEFFRAIAFLVLLTLVLALWRGAEPPADPAGNETNDPPAGQGFDVPTFPTVAGVPLVVFLAGSLLAGLVVVGYLFRGVRTGLSASSTARPPTPRAAAAQAVRVAIEEIDLGGDVRGAILACFRRFCELLGTRGVTGQAALTPREIEGLAVERLRVSPQDAGDLTSLFEEARYSEHPLGALARDRARESLERIRAALGA